MHSIGAMAAQDLIQSAESSLAFYFAEIDRLSMINQRRIIEGFHKYRLADEHFTDKTGYGRDDPARETIDKVFAHALQAEAAAVRMQLVSGTHALACALFGNLKANERLASLTGKPYDTLQEVIGLDGESGSLRAYGVNYIEGDILDALTEPDKLREKLVTLVGKPSTIAYIQKSCGYTFGRKSLANREIELVIKAVRRINPECLVLVDNCYGEFVEEREPTAVGADLIAGSLIKNPCAGLALTGGYIAGRACLVDNALRRLTAPGIGGNLGLTYGQNRLILQGLFLAPSIVAQAVKGAMLFAHVFDQIGYLVAPGPIDRRTDIIQGIKLGSSERLVTFCQAVQKACPVNAHACPEPANMPGYQDAIVMAGGSFIEGSTIELSADGPLREPYAVFLQGGLSYLHVKYALEEVLRLIGRVN